MADFNATLCQGEENENIQYVISPSVNRIQNHRVSTVTCLCLCATTATKVVLTELNYLLHIKYSVKQKKIMNYCSHATFLSYLLAWKIKDKVVFLLLVNYPAFITILINYIKTKNTIKSNKKKNHR